jgi:hypothetical protein
MAGRRGRKRKQLLDDLKETWGCWKLKAEALDCTLWRNVLSCRKGDYGFNVLDSISKFDPHCTLWWMSKEAYSCHKLRKVKHT